jgi:hypothetical protein
VVRSATADVPFGVMGVLFRRANAASSAGSVAFSFIHTNGMPVLCRFLWRLVADFFAVFPRISGFLFAAKCFKRRAETEASLTIKNRLFSCELP